MPDFSAAHDVQVCEAGAGGAHQDEGGGGGAPHQDDCAIETRMNGTLIICDPDLRAQATRSLLSLIKSFQMHRQICGSAMGAESPRFAAQYFYQTAIKQPVLYDPLIGSLMLS